MINFKEEIEDMINLCFLSGQIKNEIDLKFIYNPETKKLSKEHISITFIGLEIEKEQIVKLYAYDEMADKIYQSAKQGDFIVVQGKIREQDIEISRVYFT